MKKDRLPRMLGISIAFVLVLLLLLPTTSEAKAKFHWRFQCAFAESDLSYHLQTKTIAKVIEEASNGQVKVDTYSAGALVGPEEQFSAVVDGAIEAGLNMSMAEAEMIPEVLAISLPGGFQDNSENLEYWYKAGAFKLAQEAYREKGVYLLAISPVGRILLRARKRGILDSWDTFKNTKGWTDPTTIPILTKLGGVCVDVPGFDMYTAMKLGTIDWHEWTIAELETLGWKEVTKTVLLEPVMSVSACNVVVNLKAWEALGPKLQKKIQSAVIKVQDKIGEEYAAENMKAIEASKKYGVEFIKMSDTDINKFHKLCQEEWNNTAKLSPRTAKAIEITRELLNKKGRL